MSISNSATKAAKCVDDNRLWDRHMEMAKIGGLDNGGVDRQAFTEADCRGRQLLVSWVKERNYETNIVKAKNTQIESIVTSLAMPAMKAPSKFRLS